MTQGKSPESNRPIPTAEDWAGYEDDLDAKYAHKVTFGKSNDEVQEMYEDGRALSSAEDLCFMPRRAFRYYVHGFTQYLTSAKSQGDSGAASSFLHLMINREELDPGSVSEIFSELEPIVHHVATHQEYYDADVDIYGRFEDLERQVLAMCQMKSR